MTKRLFLCILVFAIFLAVPVFSQTPEETKIPTPEEFLGHPVGADKKLAGWDKLTEYIRLVDESSDWVIVEELGKTTLGKPFLMATFSTPDNLARLDEIQKNQKKLANPYGLSDNEARKLIDDTPLIIMVMLNQHSTEIASSQEAFELFYDYAAVPDHDVWRIFEDVVLLLIPSLNPDGMQMVTDWYMEHVGTEHEGSFMPWLYHPYAGHDNNRDWYMFNLAESRHTARQLWTRWNPEVVLDQHQMGESGPRLFIPPYIEPVNPNIDPRVWTSINKLGHHITNDLQQQGFKGVASGYMFDAWWEGAADGNPWWHNQIGMISEAASCRIATPLHFTKSTMQVNAQGLPDYNKRINFLDPWEGGWWRLRDIIDYEKALTRSLLEAVAKDKKELKQNYLAMNRDAIAKGNSEAPYAYILPMEQHDPSALRRMLKSLKLGGVRIMRAVESFQLAEVEYPEGTLIVPMAQPNRAYAKDLFEVQHFPDLREYPGGPPIEPYDATGWTFPLQMGVSSFVANEPLTVAVEELSTFHTSFPDSTWEILNSANETHLLIDTRVNTAFMAVAHLLTKGFEVYRLGEISGRDFLGHFAIENTPQAWSALKFFERKHENLGLRIMEASGPIPESAVPVTLPRIALYEPWITSMDAGWTRMLMDDFEIPYTVLRNEDFPKGKKKSKRTPAWRKGNSFDVIILPGMFSKEIKDGESEWRKYYPELPKKYQGGIGTSGIKALEKWVKDGGRLLCLEYSSELPIKHFNRFPAQNILKGVPTSDFFAPGSLLSIDVDNTHPLGLGMPSQATAYFQSSPAFRLKPYEKEHRAAASYAEHDLLQSGYMIGESMLAGACAVADIPYGEGRVILYGFPPQNRAQTWGTFKLFFNGLFYSK